MRSEPPLSPLFAALPLAADAIDRHRDRFETHPEQPLDGGRDRRPDLARQLGELLARARDDPDLDADATGENLRDDRWSREERTPSGPAAGDPGDTGDLVRGKADHLVDDAPADGQLGAAHEPVSGATDAAAATSGGPLRTGRNASPMSSGTRVRAIVAATATPNPIIRRRARPWVMITVPRTPRSGDPPTRS